MTKREKQIFNLIKNKPNITQNEIARILKVKRTSVAVHITHIIDKGFIKGRQYIIKENPDVLVVGASNMDMQGFSNSKFELHDSNIGKIRIGYGGVGRNIAVNANQLISNVKFISVISSNSFGKDLLQDLNYRQIDTRDILITDKPASIYLSIIDDKGEMLGAISDMEMLELLTPEYIATKKKSFEETDFIVIDCNLPQATIEYIANNKKPKQKIFVDTVSVEKAKKIRNILDKIDVLKTNKLEIESVYGEQLKNVKETKKACEELLKKGIKKIFVTMGSKGVLFADDKKMIKISLPKGIKAVDVTGAGDIFTAGLIYAEGNNYSTEKMAKFAQVASIMKVEKEGTVLEDLNIDKIIDRYEKIYGMNEEEEEGDNE